jgi:hypothetical protein
MGEKFHDNTELAFSSLPSAASFERDLDFRGLLARSTVVEGFCSVRPRFAQSLREDIEFTTLRLHHLLWKN